MSTHVFLVGLMWDRLFLIYAKDYASELYSTPLPLHPLLNKCANIVQSFASEKCTACYEDMYVWIKSNQD